MKLCTILIFSCHHSLVRYIHSTVCNVVEGQHCLLGQHPFLKLLPVADLLRPDDPGAHVLCQLRELLVVKDAGHLGTALATVGLHVCRAQDKARSLELWAAES